MQAIYKPKGKALEYCERAVNLYRGCGHGCAYCYAPNALHMPRAAFGAPEPRHGVVAAIGKDAAKHAGREVLLCFTTDPYHPASDNTTRGAILALQTGGCRVTILTKSGERSARDFDILRPGLDRYGATLTFNNDADSLAWEPGASLPLERIAMLRLAKLKGIATWASLEPVIDPAQSLRLIAMTRGVVDLYKIGRWNHDSRANAIDWRAFAVAAVAACKAQGSPFVLKKDLAVHLPTSIAAA
jgi:DNA repair photolyase